MGAVTASMLALWAFAAVNPVRAQAEDRARSEVSELLNALCPGRCVLLSVEARVEDEPVGDAAPGFQAVSPGAKVPTVQRVSVSLLADEALPAAFRAKLKTLVAQRLKPLGAPAVVTVEPLEIPVLEKPAPAPLPVAAPQEEKKPAPPVVVEAPREPQWMALIGPALAVMALLSLALVAVASVIAGRQKAPAPERSEKPQPAPVPEPAARSARSVRRLPRMDRLVSEDRSLRNAVVREALSRGEVEVVAEWVRELGDGVIADLAGDATLAPSLLSLAQRLPEAGRDEEGAERALFDFEARLLALRLSRAAEPAERAFDFVETVASDRLLEALRAMAPGARVVALRFAPAHLRPQLFAALTVAEREAFAQGCLAAPHVGMAAVRDAAEELRARLTETSGGVAQAERALVDLLEGLPRTEQDVLLAKVQTERPGALAGHLTESALLVLDAAAVGAALLRVARPSLAAYLSGAEALLRNRVLEAAPGGLRRALEEELAATSTPSPDDFLRARRLLMAAVREEARRAPPATPRPEGPTLATGA